MSFAAPTWGQDVIGRLDALHQLALFHVPNLDQLVCTCGQVAAIKRPAQGSNSALELLGENLLACLQV